MFIVLFIRQLDTQRTRYVICTKSAFASYVCYLQNLLIAIAIPTPSSS